MPNCETHLCPLAITNTLFPICPVEWVLERVDHHLVKDVVFEDEQLDLVFSDGLVMSIEKVFRRAEGGKLAWLNYDAEEFLETFYRARVAAVAVIPMVEPVDTCYLEVTFRKEDCPMEYIAIVEFFRLFSLDQNKPITYFGDENGPQ